MQVLRFINCLVYAAIICYLGSIMIDHFSKVRADHLIRAYTIDEGLQDESSHKNSNR